MKISNNQIKIFKQSSESKLMSPQKSIEMIVKVPSWEISPLKDNPQQKSKAK